MAAEVQARPVSRPSQPGISRIRAAQTGFQRGQKWAIHKADARPPAECCTALSSCRCTNASGWCRRAPPAAPAARPPLLRRACRPLPQRSRPQRPLPQRLPQRARRPSASASQHCPRCWPSTGKQRPPLGCRPSSEPAAGHPPPGSPAARSQETTTQNSHWQRSPELRPQCGWNRKHR